MAEITQIRVHGDPRNPTVVYLPGMHGDWRLIGLFRQMVSRQVRLVEVAYPRLLDWSLADYAAGVDEALRSAGVTGGWLLGESFGSQVTWAMLERSRTGQGALRIDGVVLAGGFIRYDECWAGLWLPQAWMHSMLKRYAKFMAWLLALGDRPELLAEVNEFVRLRDELDRQVLLKRMELVMRNDPRETVRRVEAPVYCLAGLFDLIVSASGVRSWLTRNCPGYRTSRTVRRADHNVLGTAPSESAKQVVRWVKGVDAR